MKHYRVGLVGFGMIGKVHAFGYLTLPFYVHPLPGEFRLTHIATSRAETARAAQEMCKAEHACCDYREITENPDIDIVNICTPNDSHFEILESAIRHHKRIYCEKPLCTSREQAETLLAIMEECGYNKTHQLTFHLRFFPAVMRMKQMLQEQKLGRILQFRLSYLHASNASPDIPFKWKHAQGGGVVRDLGSHVLDLTDHLLGPLETIYAQRQLAYPQRPEYAPSTERPEPKMFPVQNEDAVSMLVRTQNGAHGMLEASKLATGNEDELRVEIHGEKGALRFSLMQPHYLEYFDATASDAPLGGVSGWTHIACGGRFEPPQTSFPSPKSTLGWTRAHVSCLANFLQAVAEERPTQPDLHQGAKVETLMNCVFRSSEENREVKVES